jgi:hypothetical protein
MYKEKGIGLKESFPTNSAMIQARRKLKPQLLEDLNTLIIDKFYDINERNDTIETWNKHLIWAIDGTRLDIPDTPSNRETFSIYNHRNIPNGKCQADGLIMYDSCNDLPLIGHLGPMKSEPQTFLDHFLPRIHTNPFLNQKDRAIFVFDRGYTSYKLFAELIRNELKFVIRVKTAGTYKSIMKFRDSMDIDTIIDIVVPYYIKEDINGANLPNTIKIRAIKVFLDSGEVEILITNLLDSKVFPTNCFKELYFKRWPVETTIGFLKNVLVIERFSSKITQFIFQDFFASILTYTISTLINIDVKNHDKNYKKRHNKYHRKYSYKPNRRLLLTSVINYICAIVCGKQDLKEYYYDLIMKWGDSQWVPIRINRNIMRKFKTDSWRLVYHLYYKKVYS